MLSRVIWVFKLTTAPDDAAVASPRTGGWSEGMWIEDLTLASDRIREVASRRAKLLPKQAAITGCRVANYQIVGNAVKPLGTSTQKFFYPGLSGADCDVPQMALELSGTSEGKTNSNRFTLRGLPDVYVKGGEYSPTSAFTRNLNDYILWVKDRGWGFIGRKMSNALYPNRGIANNAISVVDVPGVIVGSSYLRFHGVRNNLGNAVSGSFRITGVVGATYTLAGLPNFTTTEAVGNVRLDEVEFCNFDDIKVSQVVVRKIGRPSGGYRGKASKR